MNKFEDDDKLKIVLFGLPFIVLVALVIYAPIALFNAWVVLNLYNWFALPLGAPGINIWHIWGLLLIAGRLTGDYNSSKSSTKTFLSNTAGFIIGGLLLLLIGFILKSHIGV